MLSSATSCSGLMNGPREGMSVEQHVTAHHRQAAAIACFSLSAFCAAHTRCIPMQSLQQQRWGSSCGSTATCCSNSTRFVCQLSIHQRHTRDIETQDDARSVAVEVREVFWQRKDKLQERRSWPLKETTWEVLAPGARGALKQATLVKGLRRDLLFYHQVTHTQSATPSLPGFFRTDV